MHGGRQQRRKADKRGPAGMVRLAGIARRSRRGLLLGTALQSTVVLVLALPTTLTPAWAQPAPNARPAGGVVVGGTASISHTATATTIDQSSQRAAINWQSFDVGAQQSVNFHQPSASAMALNRVEGPNPSQIAGHINANGQVILQNQDGITFYKGAQINTAGFIATAAGISTRNFMAGHMVFDQPAKPGARIMNEGHITVREAGIAALVAPQVANSGVITAKLGRVVLAGAETYVLDLYGDGLVSIDVNGAVTQVPDGPDGKPVAALVTNTGTILADGGKVELTAREAAGLVQNLVDAGGTVAAPTVGQKTGEIVLSGIGGSLVVPGALLAQGKAAGTKGGQIEVGSDGGVSIAATARIDASGAAGGGTVAIGTDLVRAARGPSVTPAVLSHDVTVARGAIVAADATVKGDGGRVSVLSDGSTVMDGQISARGGPQGGDGGFAEVSGRTLGFDGMIHLGAPVGDPGSVLFDPGTLLVVSGTAGTGSLDGLLPAVSYSDGGATDTVSNSALDQVGLSADITLQATTLLEVTNGAPINVANGLTMESGGDLVINDSVTAGGALALAAGMINPGGGLTLNAPIASLGSIYYSYGTINLAAGTGGIAINAPVTAGVSYGEIQIDTTGPVTQTAPLLNVDFLGGSAGSVALTNAGNRINYLGSLAASGNLDLVSNLDLYLIGGNVTASNISLEVARAGGTLSIIAGDVPSTLIVPQGGRISLEADNLLLGSSYSGGAVPPVLIAPDGVVALAPYTPDMPVVFDQGSTATLGGGSTAYLLITPSDLAAIQPGIGTLQVGEAVGPVTVGGITFDVPVDLTSLASTLALETTGAITQAAGATVSVGTLVGATGPVTLDQANDIAALGSLSTAGSLVLNDVGPLDIAGLVTAAGAVDLISGGTIGETGGLITPLLSGSSVGSTSLTGGNTIAALGGFTATGGDFTLTDTGGLNVSGPLDAQVVSLTASGTIGIPGTITATTSVALAAGGTIGGSGALITPLLSGSSDGSTSLTGGNTIGTLSGFTATGGNFTLNDTGGLSVSGPILTGNVTLLSVGTMSLAGAIAPGSRSNVLLQVAADASGQAHFEAGSITVGDPAPNSGSLTIALPASGGIATFRDLYAPGMNVTLTLGGGTASGQLVAGTLLVQGQGGGATLYGGVGDIFTPLAALISRITPATNPAYTMNGCVIAANFCSFQLGLTAGFGGLQQPPLFGSPPPVPDLTSFELDWLGFPLVAPDRLTAPGVVPPPIAAVDY